VRRWFGNRLAGKQADETVDALAHDLQNLLTAMSMALPSTADVGAVDTASLVSDLDRSLSSAVKMVRAMRALYRAELEEPATRDSVEGMVRLAVALLRRKDGRVKLAVRGDFEFVGRRIDALRVIQNLLFNAQREAESIEGGYVRVELESNELRVSNPVRDPDALDGSIYARGRSLRGSSGLGLANAVAVAQTLGWKVDHVMQEGPLGANWVCFRVKPV
jgi:signal transduction histidine kinase